MTKRTPAQERFWTKVDKSGDCWLWVAATNPAGYGRFGIWPDTCLAHRFSYEEAYGPIREGLVVDHKCHTPACVNPKHLQLTTYAENQQNRAGPTKRSKSGVRGVTWCSRDQRWLAGVRHKGRTYNLGRYDTLEAAEAAVVAGRNRLYTNNLKDRMVAS